ncbi:MAG: S-layer homology domain-containing protein [Fimbriimonadales bacterium]|nr:S-layer homology domain-containing protein [Fimbriimonadales bacterium]MCS7190471.1 S-layer homology domain-containing protein [Fimbriimonadales bacterium]
MLWGLAGAQSLPTLAVGAFEGDDETLTQAVRQQVVQTLSRSMHLQIADRAQLRAVLQERRLRELGLTGEPEPTPAPLATARRLLVGRVSVVGNRVQIDLSCHDISTGATLTGGAESVSGIRAEWEPLAQRAAERIHRRLTGKSLPVNFAIEPLPDEGVPPDFDARDYLSSPHREHIERALQRGWMRLYPDGTFRPDEPVSGVYFHALLQRLTGRLGGTPDYVPEKPDETLTCVQAVRFLAQLGACQPRASYLHPPAWAQRALKPEELRAPLTRARLAALLSALMQSVQEAER